MIQALEMVAASKRQSLRRPRSMEMVAASKRQSLSRPRSSISLASDEFITKITDKIEMMGGRLVGDVQTDDLDVYENEHEVEVAITAIYKKWVKCVKLDHIGPNLDSINKEMKKCRISCEFLDLGRSVYMCVYYFLQTKILYAGMESSQKSKGTTGRWLISIVCPLIMSMTMTMIILRRFLLDHNP